MSDPITDSETELPRPGDAGHVPPRAPAPVPPEWRGLLDPGEEIIWQGRPVAGIDGNDFSPGRSAMGVVMTGFAIFWLSKLHAMRVPRDAAWLEAFMSLFGLMFVALGLREAGGYILLNALKRGRTYYTLTNRRAFIARTSLLGRKSLKSYPIDAGTVLDYDGAEPATIHFATETRKGQKGRTYSVPIGFERVRDGRALYRAMRDVQTGERDE